MRFFPPEWHPQEGILITWPHSQSAWKADLGFIEPTFLNLIKTISDLNETVFVVIDPSVDLINLKNIFLEHAIHLELIRWIDAPTNDTWIRDYGPITVFEDQKRIFLDFQFNGWGGKFDARLDNQVNAHLFQNNYFSDAALKKVNRILEGGSIETDGRGTILTTTCCLTTPTRNPLLSQSDVEALLRAELGIKQVLWLDHGALEGDDTDGHVDMMARFCDEHTVAYVLPEKIDHDHRTLFEAMERQLKSFRDIQGKPYRCVPIDLPPPIYSAEGDRLPATYLNFLIVNQAVLVPVYGVDTDSRALQQLETCFPQHQIIPIDSLALIHQGGSIHCTTMQIPQTFHSL